MALPDGLGVVGADESTWHTPSPLDAATAVTIAAGPMATAATTATTGPRRGGCCACPGVRAGLRHRQRLDRSCPLRAVPPPQLAAPGRVGVPAGAAHPPRYRWGRVAT